MTVSRITLARLHKGWTKKQLAEKIGISAVAITKFENGTASPSTKNLKAIADCLGFPISFFSLDEIDIPSPECISFRARRKMTRRQRDQALSNSTFGLMLSDWMDDEYSLPSVSIPDLSELDPSAAANYLRGCWGLGEQPIADMIALLEYHGVRVFSVQEASPVIDAYSFWDEDRNRPFVFLTTSKSPERRRMDAAHELGHLILHRKVDLTEGHRDLESEANQFASALLMPVHGFSSSIPPVPALADLMAVKKEWKVPLAAATYRAHSLGLISDWQYRTYFQQISAKGFRSAEPDSISPERSQVLEKIIALESGGRQGIRSIAKKAGVPEETVGSLMFSIPGKVIEGKGRTETVPTTKLRIV